MTITFTEENYLKAIYGLALDAEKRIPNLAIAEKLAINPATVTEMLRKLNDKKLIDYSRLEGATLSETGNRLALQVIRRHRLWETFLVQKLEFKWDEVHEIAEQLEHVQSDKLLNQLDKLLGYPKFDPHGDPIPDNEGKLPELKTIILADGSLNVSYHLAGVLNHSPAFLRFLDKIQFNINDSIKIIEVQDFDKSMAVLINETFRTIFSSEVLRNLLVI